MITLKCPLCEHEERSNDEDSVQFYIKGHLFSRHNPPSLGMTYADWAGFIYGTSDANDFLLRWHQYLLGVADDETQAASD